MKREQPETGGFVSLVGAGPGDPELLTLRAFRLLRTAQVVLYDHLVPAEIVDLAPRDAERIYVGKQSSNHSLPQAEINALLVRLAREGKHVVRLKGGDPFMFGRGGEETAALLEQGIPFEVVPGITAAAGAAAYAGIPLTHRDYAQSCVFATGHLKDGTAQLDWPALVRPNQTVAIYMALGALAQICEGLMAHGLPGSTPAALVENATLPEQRVVEATLATLTARAKAEGVAPPALLIVGEVVRLRAKTVSGTVFDGVETVGDAACPDEVHAVLRAHATAGDVRHLGVPLPGGFQVHRDPVDER